MSAPVSAAEIAKSSQSNLALAFVALPKERRVDITTFYAFCRIVDDIADEPGSTRAGKQEELDRWKRAIVGPAHPDPPLAEEVRGLIERYAIPRELFLEIIAGVEMDLMPARFDTFEELRVYCYRVASAVGLVSIEIFGYRNEACKRYAVDLGLALQITNILRDVGVDLANGGRVYLPREDLEKFGYSTEDLLGRRHTGAFMALMSFEADRAEAFYRSAVASLPPEDRGTMVAAEIMRNVYHALLRKMRRDRFRVFERKYALGKTRKLAIIARVLLGQMF